ncbi:hypothetical protein [Streptomyces sp. NPDC048442]|uniref:hypothetical protein n=1 Tax=Streptomyces sp. NPDC048442 TaxID=3154823 RepID=UPI0034322ADC
MHSDMFRHLHAARSAELQQQAAVQRRARSVERKGTPRHAIRIQLGWTLVDLGLRLVRTTGAATAVTSTASSAGEHRFRTAGAS